MRKPFGFTLIELLVVIVILGILASITIVGFSKQIELAAEAKAKTNLKIIWSNEKEFYSFQGRYTKDWTLLTITKPIDEKYNYEITKATEDELEIRADRKGRAESFVIYTNGEIAKF